MNQIPTTPPRRTLMPVIIGFAFAALLLFALGWLSRRARNAATAVSPSVVLIAPARDTTAGDSLSLTFSTSIPIELQQTGWGAGRYHLHTMVNTVELMPAAVDIKPIGENRYTWTVPLRDSVSTVYMLWALPNHSRVPEGASDTIVVRSSVTTPLQSHTPAVTDHSNH